VQTGDLEQEAPAAVQLSSGDSDVALQLQRGDADDRTQQVLLDTEVRQGAQVADPAGAVGPDHRSGISLIDRRHAEFVGRPTMLGRQVGLGGGIGVSQPCGQAKGDDTGPQDDSETYWIGGKARRIHVRWYHGRCSI